MAFNAKNVYAEKEALSQILRMLVGLRKSWASTAHVAREGAAEYSTQGQGIDKACDKEQITRRSPGKHGSAYRSTAVPKHGFGQD